MNLRDYQQQAISDLRNAYRSGARAPLLVAPTGAGKTIILAAIAAGAVARDRQVLILVHRRELIRQASDKLTAAGVRHGVIAAGFPASHAQVQLASVQTLVKRLEWCDCNPSLIVIDEAHHAAAGSWDRVLRHWPDAYRLGVTATPCRLDGRGLAQAFDHLVLGPSVASLIDAAYLTGARIYAPPQVADLSGIRRRAGDYPADQAADAMNRPTVTGDAIAHYRKLADGQQAIAFCCSIDHANAVCAAFTAAGINAATLLGNTTNRDQVVAAFGVGSLQILVTVDVVSEGFDIPAASCAILLRPTQSLGLYLQQVGRVLRPSPGKPHALVLDHVGNVTRHGFPDDDRDWTLADGVRRNAAANAPSVRTCPECFAAFKPAPQCPVCGAVCAPIKSRVIREMAGELTELRREAVRAAKRDQGRARTLPELLALAKQRGYSPGWAYRIFHARGQR